MAGSPQPGRAHWRDMPGTVAKRPVPEADPRHVLLRR